MVEYLDEYKIDCKSLGMGDHTIESYVSNIIIFFDYTRVSVDNIKTSHLIKFLNYLRFDKEIKCSGKIKQGCAKSTIKTYFSSLHSYFEFLVFNENIEHNPVIRFRKRYLRHVKRDFGPEHIRQLVSVRDMAKMVYYSDDYLTRALIITLAKTGLRRNELITLDLDNLNLDTGTIYLKPTAKRSNRIVFIDSETIGIIQQYLSHREIVKSNALFTSKYGNRVNRGRVYQLVTECAFKSGFHDPNGLLIEKFTPHCCRHWFTTHLSRAGMSTRYIQTLRGDVVKDAVDIYTHIDFDLLKEEYLNRIPQLSDSLLNLHGKHDQPAV